MRWNRVCPPEMVVSTDKSPAESCYCPKRPLEEEEEKKKNFASEEELIGHDSAWIWKERMGHLELPLSRDSGWFVDGQHSRHQRSEAMEGRMQASKQAKLRALFSRFLSRQNIVASILLGVLATGPSHICPLVDCREPAIFVNRLHFFSFLSSPCSSSPPPSSPNRKRRKTP
jgi:hypothetical protein